jgi:hypothetical protein
MNPLDIKKRLKFFAEKLATHSPLSNEECEYLASSLTRIADGEDANHVFGVKFGRGNSLKDAKNRQAISFIVHWIECAVQPTNGEIAGLGLSVSAACAEAAPILRKMLGVDDSQKYDDEYIRQCYYKPEFAHMRSVLRGTFDQDSPFQP